ncbi:MAG: ZIP family metal transporter [Sandaracinus sp.]|nr:ZIP family metal transporter [Sandaracinus sp.]
MSATLLLVGSLAALGLAPLLHGLIRRVPHGAAVLRWGVLLGVSVLVVGHVLPVCMASCGNAAVFLALVGLGVPVLAERFARKKASGSTPWAMLAVSGLGLHALMDGAALGLTDRVPGHALQLGLAVLLHRIPVGMGLWAVLPRSAALVAFAILGGGALVGYAVGVELAPALDAPALAMLQAFAAGVLLHVFAHAALDGHEGVLHAHATAK